MDFLSFCETIASKKAIVDKKVAFIGLSEQLALEYRALCRILFVRNKIDFGEILTLSTDTIDQHIATLSISFLGSIKTYWILGIDTVSPLMQKKWLQLLASVDSPHNMFIIHNQKGIQIGKSITLKQAMYQKEAESLASLISGKPILQIKPFFAAISNIKQRISPAMLLQILGYTQVINTKSELFFTHWIPKIFGQDESLFQLSDVFFSRNTDQFLSLFYSLSFQYPLAFWCTFFSEQSYKASLIIHAKQNGTTISPELEYRLPFNFSKKYYALHSFSALVRLHEDITHFDIAFKTGQVSEKKLEVILLAYLGQ